MKPEWKNNYPYRSWELSTDDRKYASVESRTTGYLNPDVWSVWVYVKDSPEFVGDFPFLKESQTAAEDALRKEGVEL